MGKIMDREVTPAQIGALLAAMARQILAGVEGPRRDVAFRAELADLLRDYVGRPTPLTHAERLSAHLGCHVYLKREDLCHTGAHKINNALGQGLLVKRMGKQRVVAETGAGQHGVAAATVCSLLGAEVRGVESGSRTLKDAINEARRDWVSNVRTTHYLLDSVLGGHPYPTMVRDFQAVIGKEARSQFLGQVGALPDLLVACVGGGSNAIGLFHAFLEDPVEMVGVEAGGRSDRPGDHAARFVGSGASVGVLHGTRTYVLQDEAGNILPTHSVSAGLDYPAVGPEHAQLHDEGRVRYTAVGDAEAMAAFHLLSEKEGLIPALESAHAVGLLVREARALEGKRLILNLSGRGDKDLGILDGP